MEGEGRVDPQHYAYNDCDDVEGEAVLGRWSALHHAQIWRQFRLLRLGHGVRQAEHTA